VLEGAVLELVYLNPGVMEITRLAARPDAIPAAGVFDDRYLEAVGQAGDRSAPGIGGHHERRDALRPADTPRASLRDGQIRMVGGLPPRRRRRNPRLLRRNVSGLCNRRLRQVLCS